MVCRRSASSDPHRTKRTHLAVGNASNPFTANDVIIRLNVDGNPVGAVTVAALAGITLQFSESDTTIADRPILAYRR